MNEIKAYVAAVVGTLIGMTISEEEWNKLTDVELERTKHIFFKTPSGKRVEYIRADVLDEIRAELHATAEMHEDGDYYLREEWIDEIFDKYRAESEVQDADSN